MNFREYLPYYKRNIKVALPVMLTQAGQITVQLADNIMVGHIGAAELAGVSFANSIVIIGLVFGIGFTQGVTPLVGQSFGRKNFGRVGLLLQNSFIISCIMALLLTITMIVSGIFMDRMGQTTEVLHFAKAYYNIGIISLMPFLVFMALRQFSEGVGITKYAMYITISGNIINIFLNWVLIFGHIGFTPMGVAGAATATLVSRTIMVITFIIIYMKLQDYNKYFRFFSKKLIDRKIVKEIFKTSIPLSFQNLVEITAFSMSAIMIGWTGYIALAGHQIAMSMSSVSFMLALGVGAAATIRVSHQYGSQDYHSMKIAGYAAVHLSVLLMSISGILFIVFRHQIPYLYNNDPQVVAMASKLLIIAALYQVFDAIQLAGLACLRALADVRVPLIMSIFSYYLVCLPLGYLCGFTFDMGAIGVWIGLLFGLAFAAVFFIARFKRNCNKIIKNGYYSIQ